MKLRTVMIALLLAVILLGSFGAVAHADDDDERDGRGKACKGKNKKNCEIPEVPWALMLPVAGLMGATGYYLVQRRNGAANRA